jgi:hypothetical protein
MGVETRSTSSTETECREFRDEAAEAFAGSALAW